MILSFLYWILILLEVVFVFGIALYMLFLLYSSLMGSPYVSSKKKQLEAVFDSIPFKKKVRFIDLGCGDGRVVMQVAQQYKIQAVGVDINPMMIAWARLKNKFARISNIEFRVENIFKTKLEDFDIVYLFLMPKLLTQLTPKLLKETKKDALILSHGFKIEGWDKYCYKTLSGIPFPTYFYRLSK